MRRWQVDAGLDDLEVRPRPAGRPPRCASCASSRPTEARGLEPPRSPGRPRRRSSAAERGDVGAGIQASAGRRLSGYAGIKPALEDLEARVAALEADRADYRAVLAAVNAIGANQREHALAIGELRNDSIEVKSELREVKTELREFRRSTEEHLAELKDLIVGLRDT